MQLFLYEIKKIFSWKIILLLILINILLYKLLIEFELEYFPNGRPAGDVFNIEQEVIPKYGAEMDENEFLDLYAMYEKELAKTDVYKDFKDTIGNNNYETLSSASEYYEIPSEDKDLIYVLQSYEWLIDQYKTNEEYLEMLIQDPLLTSAQKKRYEEILDEEKFTIYSNVVTKNFKVYRTWMAIIIFFSMVVLISPIFNRDLRAEVVPLQYSSKKGRKIYRTKWIAGLVSSIIVTSILLLLYMALYTTNNTATHFNLPMYVFEPNYWFDITFLQDIILSVIVIFILSLILSILTMLFSTTVPNMIGLIAIQIVVMFVMIAGGAYWILRGLNDMWFPKYFTPVVLILFAIVIGSVTWHVWRREGRKDII